VSKQVYLLLVIIWTAIIVVSCLMSANSFPKIAITGIDLMVHFSFYFIYTFLLGIYIYKAFAIVNKLKPFLIASTWSFAVGCTVEIFQTYFTNSRHGEWVDVFANMLGTLGAVFIFGFAIKETVLKRF
jgi:VanZ family protein